MARTPNVPGELFLDASFAIALSSPRDQHHEQAARLASQVEQRGVQLVTTRAVVLEIGNALAKRRHREAAAALLDALEHDPSVQVIPLSEELFQRGWALYRQHQDKEWGLTDCISFVVMRDRGLTDALTADEHFRQAGFRALLTAQ